MRRLYYLGFILLMTGALSCDDDDATVVVPPPHDEKLDVLENMELAYTRRHVSEYEKILDENFTMFFASGDVSNGRTPAQWGRPDEEQAIEHLFDPNYADADPSNGIQPRCRNMLLDVRWEDGVEWEAIVPQSAPDETWYRATVYYDFQFDIEPDLTLINNPGTQAEFTVRNAGTDEAPDWKLVQMSDLGTPALLSTSTEPSTWGSVKALYR